MPYIPVAVEMYSVRKEFTADPLGTMKALKAMGYEGVEFAGAPQFSPNFYRSLLEETGLVCCGWHTPWERLQPENLEETVRLNLAVGNKYVIVPYLSARTHQDWENLGNQLNDAADALAKYGMRTGYHCHATDFVPLEGKRTWDTFMGVANNRTIMQLDTGNAQEGGADILGELNKYPGRCKTIHLKPYSLTKGFAPVIGEDDCPWKDIFNYCETKGDTEWYVIEYESEALPAMDAVKRCLDAVRKML